MITYPNAKINLGLNIVEKRPDGYHNLETIFYPINLQDALEVNKLEGDGEYTLKVSGTQIEGEPDNNLVVKAYRLLKKDFPRFAARCLSTISEQRSARTRAPALWRFSSSARKGHKPKSQSCAF